MRATLFPNKEEAEAFEDAWKTWNRSVGIDKATSVMDERGIRLMYFFWKMGRGEREGALLV